jgi:hypothetical protein
MVRPVLLLFFAFLFFSCVDEVQLPARSVESRLVVEGLITNEAPPYTVKLSYTGQYNSLIYGQNEIPLNGAVVSITELGGRTVTLDQDPLTPLFFWMRDSTFQGKPGKSYQLRVQLADGKTYISEPDLLNKVPQIDRIYAEFRGRADGDVYNPDHYDVLLDTKDPATVGNYYRWSGYGYIPRISTGEPVGMSVCCKWCWIPTYGTVTDVLSDVLINGNTISRRPVFTSPIYYVGRHYIEISQYSLTKSAYQFWVKFEEQRQRNGSLFDPLPASIEGNVHLEDDPNTVALGYFGSSAVNKQRLVIPGDTLNLARLEIKYDNVFIKEGNCQRVYSQGQLSPPSW